MVLGGKEYEVVDYITHVGLNKPVPLVALPMMSDYKWQSKCLKDRLKNPDKYAEMGEDVQAAIKELEEWLATHEVKAAAM